MCVCGCVGACVRVYACVWAYSCIDIATAKYIDITDRILTLNALVTVLVYLVN